MMTAWRNQGTQKSSFDLRFDLSYECLSINCQFAGQKKVDRVDSRDSVDHEFRPQT